MKLFIHRWFSGSAHPKFWWNYKGRKLQWNYPRLANYAVPMMAGAIITGGHLFFVIGFCMVVPLFLYTALNPLSLEEWYECYKNYWKTKGYALWFPYPDSVYEYQTHFVTLKKGAISWGNISREGAIQKFFFEIYGKWPMRV